MGRSGVCAATSRSATGGSGTPSPPSRGVQTATILEGREGRTFLSRVTGGRDSGGCRPDRSLLKEGDERKRRHQVRVWESGVGREEVEGPRVRIPTSSPTPTPGVSVSTTLLSGRRDTSESSRTP